MSGDIRVVVGKVLGDSVLVVASTWDGTPVTLAHLTGSAILHGAPVGVEVASGSVWTFRRPVGAPAGRAIFSRAQGEVRSGVVKIPAIGVVLRRASLKERMWRILLAVAAEARDVASRIRSALS